MEQIDLTYFFMKKQLFALFLSLLILSSPLLAQNRLGIGEWRTYLSHNSVRQCVEKDGTIYAITQGGMFTFNDSTKEIKTYSTIEGLSSTEPTTIFSDNISGLIFIGYADGTINFFSDPSEIRYLTDIRRNDFFTQKRINQFDSDGAKLYVATDFGIVVYRLWTFLTEFTITQFGENPSKEPVNSLAVNQGSLWASLGDLGLFHAPLNSINLTDPSVWTREDGSNELPITNVLELASWKNRLFARVDTTVYKQTDGGQWAIDPILDKPWDYLSSQNNALTASKNAATVVFPNDGSAYQYSTEGKVVHSVHTGKGLTFLANEFGSLQRHQKEQTHELISPDGPLNNNATRIVAGNGEFYVAPKGYDDGFNPVADGSGIYYYSDDTGWEILNGRNGGLPETGVNERFARALYNPNTRQAYIGSWGRGIARLKDGVLEEVYDCSNSGLSYVVGNTCDLNNAVNTRVSGIAEDPQGNIWVTQSFAQRPLAVMTTTGEWYNYPGNLFPDANMIDLIVDDYGSKWILSRKNGVVVFNENGTFDNTADDIIVKLTSGLNLGDLPSDNVLSIAKDKDGFIWVGTDIGVTVFFDPFTVSQGQRVDASCPVFELRCLLKDEQINAIAVDGGNRKWMATDNGVFLVSEDGDELIHNFTTDNSPLLSNSVLDVSIDGSTGEVFFATEKGLISYQGDATEGSTDCKDVLVFPNPVFQSFDGQISIKGSASASKVRITTASGMLVRELTAQGGTATWDGYDLYGNKVASGIYLALISRDDGTKGCVGKFSILNR